jgi:hypothetical protein
MSLIEMTENLALERGSPSSNKERGERISEIVQALVSILSICEDDVPEERQTYSGITDEQYGSMIKENNIISMKGQIGIGSTELLFKDITVPSFFYKMLHVYLRRNDRSVRIFTASANYCID